jgi:TRAP-type C4-dicarboxylate transport system permease large subunit
MGELNKELWPMLAIQMVVLAIITMVPAISLVLPQWVGRI